MKKEPFQDISMLRINVQTLVQIVKLFVIIILLSNIKVYAADSSPESDKYYDGSADYLFASLNDNNITIQEVTISGRVTDSETGEGLPGVNVIVDGTTVGTTTNVDGNYQVQVPATATSLRYSYVGYVIQVIPIEGRSEINISLVPSYRELEEIVVVGYGTQRRINLTGAVDQVTGEALEGRNVGNITQGLQGVLPNVNIRPLDGKPIESPSINIRGVGSIGQGGNALILIDGMEGDPSMLNPNDIETISVLKDAASAAIYGARGVFGVVLITTKSPQTDVISVEYSANYGIKSPIIRPNFDTDGYRFANMFNQIFFDRDGLYPRQINKTQLFSQEYLAELKRRSEDPSLPKTDLDDQGRYVYYHNTDWYGLLYKDNFGSTEHNLSVSGGTDKTRFMVSGRYAGQDGLYRYSSDNYNMYNLRARGSVDVFPWLQIENNFDYSDRFYFNPLNTGEGTSLQRNIADEGHPTAPMLNPDGTLSYSAAYTVGDMYLGYNGSHLDRSVIRNSTGFNTRFLDERFRVIGNLSFQNTNSDELRIRTPVPYSPAPGVIEYVGTNNNDIRNTLDRTNFLATNLYSEFEDYFSEVHYFKAMVGFNYEESTWQRHRYSRNQVLFPTLRDVNLAVGENVLASGGYDRWRIAGGFFRLNYIYGNRYLVEFNGRYDGSSKFPTDEMYAFFPSVSAAWRISEEAFWPVPFEIVSDLKLRASYGSLGNANISPYLFHEQFNLGTSIILDGIRPSLTNMPAVLPDGLTWETSTTRNIGLDLAMINNKLQFTGDAYIRKTTDMYTIGMTLPATFGTSSPRGNYADMETRGWELMLSWRDQFTLAAKPFGYNIRLSLSDWQAEILRYNNPDRFLNDYYEGMRVGEVWGYVTEGFFTSEQDVANHANQRAQFPPFRGEYMPGDIKLRDLNGDGFINPGRNTVDDPGDRQIIGNLTPRYTFGINLGSSWNNISFSAFFQGVGKQDWYPHLEAANFWGQYNRPYADIPKWHLNEGIIWSESNPDSFLPRYIARGGTGALLRQTQTKYLMNAAYIRLRNIQLGYDLPLTLISRAGMSAARVFVSGESLWTWSPLYRIVEKQIDVENATAPSDQMYTSGNSGDGYNYPMLKSVTFGLNVRF
jgi:TonB-linked SusC/RagA family outer membrane protein